MKKLIIIVVTMLSLSATVFANPDKISKHIVDAFNREFAGAQDATWQTASEDMFQVSFEYNGVRAFAYFNAKAELLGVMRHMLSTDLPYYLQKELKKEYAGYWIADLFEISNEEGTSYYVTLQDGSNKVVLESKDQDSWYVYKKYKEL